MVKFGGAMVKPVGMWAFMVGVFGSLLIGLLSGLGFFTAGAWITTLLVATGVVIGLLNITEQESVPLMVAVAALTVSGGALAVLPFGELWQSLGASLGSAMAGAVVVVAVNTIIRITRH